VRARTLFEVESVRKLRRDKAFKFVEKKHRESVPWSV
jgi:hypothetical protein